MEHLWILLALSLTGVFIALVPTSPNDFWWHLKAGELIARGDFPQSNLFAWTLPADTPYIFQSWLGEWLFFMLYQAGGLQLVVFARNMLGLGAFALVGVEAWRRSGSWRLAAAVVVLAVAMSLNNLTTRTQNWSWVPFVLTLLLCGFYRDGRLAVRWLVVGLPLLMVFWVNAHGAFVMGLLVVGAYVVGETVTRLLRQAHALSWGRLRGLYVAFGVMLVATLVNPLGVGIFGYVGQLLGDVPSQSLINEWQSPTPRTLAGMFFYVGVLVVIASFAFARRRPSITDVLLVCGLAWQAFVGIRYVVWFGMAAMPVVAQSLAKARSIRGGGVRLLHRDGFPGVSEGAGRLRILRWPLCWCWRWWGCSRGLSRLFLFRSPIRSFLRRCPMLRCCSAVIRRWGRVSICGESRVRGVCSMRWGMVRILTGRSIRNSGCLLIRGWNCIPSVCGRIMLP